MMLNWFLDSWKFREYEKGPSCVLGAEFLSNLSSTENLAFLILKPKQVLVDLEAASLQQEV